MTRPGGEDLPFPEKMAKILDMIKDDPDRSARFRCNVALIGPNHPVKVFEATCEGKIAESPSGAGGFGYDPIFWLEETQCSFADLTAQQKHQVSHRGKVLKQLGDYLASI